VLAYSLIAHAVAEANTVGSWLTVDEVIVVDHIRPRVVDDWRRLIAGR
jgi:hypothetical protein